MINHALRQWRAGERSLGIWLGLNDLYSAEMLAGLGFDWLCVDLQHGFMDAADLARILAATATSATTPLVRVVANEFDQIGKALDAGAHGVIVPMVNSAEEAARAVAACRYPPRGRRSNGPIRGVLDAGDYLSSANDEIACVLMIETAEGLANVEAIAATPGVDALFIGPVDMCLTLRLGATDFASPKFVDALRRVIAACVANGKTPGIFGYSAELAARYLTEGFTFASIGADTALLRAAAVDALESVRA
jgi:4-hydroxy-2-oxoheptanedioate aldolase